MAQDWTTFTISIAVKTTVKEMYDAWTIPVKTEQWFLKSCNYFDKGIPVEKNINAQANNTYEWTWYLYDEIEKGMVIQANGIDFLQFSFAGECLVDVQLTQKVEYVMVTLTQKNIPTDEKSKFNIRIGCLEGWTFYFANLKSFYENDYDLRNKRLEHKGINN